MSGSLLPTRHAPTPRHGRTGEDTAGTTQDSGLRPHPLHDVGDEADLASLGACGAEVEGEDRGDSSDQAGQPLPVEGELLLEVYQGGAQVVIHAQGQQHWAPPQCTSGLLGLRIKGMNTKMHFLNIVQMSDYQRNARYLHETSPYVGEGGGGGGGRTREQGGKGVKGQGEKQGGQGGTGRENREGRGIREVGGATG